MAGLGRERVVAFTLRRELPKHGSKWLAAYIRGASEGMIDLHHRKKCREGQDGQDRGHQDLRPQVAGAEKECECNGQDCAGKQGQPNYIGDHTGRKVKPGAARLSD